MKREATNNEIAISVGILVSNVGTIDKRLERIEEKLQKDFASKEWVNSEYGLIKKVVYTIVGLFGTAIILSLISLIIKK